MGQEKKMGKVQKLQKDFFGRKIGPSPPHIPRGKKILKSPYLEIKF